MNWVVLYVRSAVRFMYWPSGSLVAGVRRVYRWQSVCGQVLYIHLFLTRRSLLLFGTASSDYCEGALFYNKHIFYKRKYLRVVYKWDKLLIVLLCSWKNMSKQICTFVTGMVWKSFVYVIEIALSRFIPRQSVKNIMLNKTNKVIHIRQFWVSIMNAWKSSGKVLSD